MKKDRKIPKIPMIPAQQTEGIKVGSLFMEEQPVWFLRNGEVNPVWLSICKEERTQTKRLLKEVATFKNLSQAWQIVKRNKGTSGVDGQGIKGFEEWFIKNWDKLIDSLVSGSYRPSSVKRVEIPKGQGKVRVLGIPTVRDRVVHQAIQKVLQRHYDPKFSSSSYGFRPKRNAHQAVKQASNYIKGGKTYIVDIDLENFFGEVNQDRLMWLLSRRIGDKSLLNLIRKILRSGILSEGLSQQGVKGTPQGSPLSPLLSNIVLDELDQELERRGLSFVRYADDVQIFVGSQASAERVMRSIRNFIENRMRLKVNKTKSGIRRPLSSTFLGYGFMWDGSLRLSRRSEVRLKSKIKAITSRKRGVSFQQILLELRQSLSGWMNYFRLAKMQRKLQDIDGWMRRRLKSFRLKQCKRAISIANYLQKLGVSKHLSWRTALSGKGWWRLANSPAIAIGMTNQWFLEQGFYSLLENYKRHFVNYIPKKPPYT